LGAVRAHATDLPCGLRLEAISMGAPTIPSIEIPLAQRYGDGTHAARMHGLTRSHRELAERLALTHSKPPFCFIAGANCTPTSDARMPVLRHAARLRYKYRSAYYPLYTEHYGATWHTAFVGGTCFAPPNKRRGDPTDYRVEQAVPSKYAKPYCTAPH
jgi:hypothetical protein